MPFADPRTARLAAFLAEVGIEVRAGEVGEEAFLPGIDVRRGALVVDEARLEHPGDLLHEAGHLAVVPADRRAGLDGDVGDGELDPTTLERAAICWSWAAALAVGLPAEELFHDGGYRGHAAGLRRSFALGVFPGAHLLEAAGLCATGERATALGVAPFPHMLRWTRAATGPGLP